MADEASSGCGQHEAASLGDLGDPGQPGHDPGGEPLRRRPVAELTSTVTPPGVHGAVGQQHGTGVREAAVGDLLGNGTFDMLLIADGRSESSFLVTKRQRNGIDAQAIELRPYGGFAMRLVPLN